MQYFTLKETAFSLVSTQNAKDQDPEHVPVRLRVVVCEAASEGLFASCSSEVGSMVFTASFGFCCFSLKR